TWDYYANIVEITVTAPAGGAFPKQQDTGPKAAGDALIPLGKANALSIGIITASDATATSSQLMAPRATIKMRGPTINRTGPFGQAQVINNWGIDQMVVGFSQVLVAVEQEGDYGAGGKLDNVINDGAPYRDVGSGGKLAWYIDPNLNMDAKINVAMQLIAGTDTTNPTLIQTGDSPSFAFPAFSNQAADAAQGQNKLISVTATESFQLNVCAGIADPKSSLQNAVLDDNYTTLAIAAWDLDASGNVTVNATTKKFAYAASTQFTPPAGWTSASNGSTIDPTLKIPNDVGEKYEWHPPR
ncbi:MAG TPA: hypothetical protein VG056_09875, partial [Pirellulales bacterium]|nr:hypothetical protein [Pirellulales bacterium]